MSAAHQGNTHQPAQAWTEPPWSGWIETTGDALLILEAARRGLIPRVTRRLVDAERKMITSGSVFVFDEDESGIKRWTDGFFWSPSRILGNFLLYRETDKRGTRSARTADPDSDNPEASRATDGALSRPKNETTTLGIDKHRERSLCGSLTNSYKFKPDGLMKKTFSLTICGVAQHLISYYKIEDVENGRLRTPSSLPELASLAISPEYLDKIHFRNPPKVEIGADGVARYAGEGEGEENDSPSPTVSSSQIPNPIETNLPLLSDAHAAEGSPSATTKRVTKRYIPYSAPHRPPKKSKAQGPDESPSAASGSMTSPPAESSSGPVLLTPPPQHQPAPHVPPAAPSFSAPAATQLPASATYSSYPYYPQSAMTYHRPQVSGNAYPSQGYQQGTNNQSSSIPSSSSPPQVSHYPSYPTFGTQPALPTGEVASSGSQSSHTHQQQQPPQAPPHTIMQAYPPYSYYPAPHPHPQQPTPHVHSNNMPPAHASYPIYATPAVAWSYAGYPTPPPAQGPLPPPLQQMQQPHAHQQGRCDSGQAVVHRLDPQSQ